MFADRLKQIDQENSRLELSKAGAIYLLAGIWVLAVLVRIFLFTGYVNGDMGNYIQEAMALREGNYSIHEALASTELVDLVPGPNFNWQNLRIGLIALDSLSMKIFGINDFSYAVLMFGFFSLSFFLTYAIGVRLHSRAFGVVAALLFAFIPKEINLSTILVPHLPADALMALACYFLIRGLDTREQARSGYAPFFLSGAAVGFAYMVHELSILLLPVLVLMFWARIPLKKILTDKGNLIALALTLSGFALVFLAEQMYFFTTTGVLLLRFKFIAAMSQKWIQLNPVDLNTIKYSIYPRAMFTSYDYGIFYFLVAAGIGTLIFKSVNSPDKFAGMRKTHLLPLIWFAFIFLYLQFGSTSMTSYKPVFKIPHYLSFIAVPAALLAAPFPFALLSAGAGRLRISRWGAILPKLAGMCILAFFASSSILFAWVNYSGNGSSRPDLTNEKKIKAAIEKLGPYEIYTDIWTKHGLDFAFGYRKKIIAYNAARPGARQALPDLSSANHGLVIVNWIYLNSPYTMAATIPDIIRHPPKTWQLMDKIAGRSHSIDIYKINEISAHLSEGRSDE